MQKLHLVGFTAEFDGLIFSTRKGARSGSFVVPLDGRLLKQIADAERHRDGGDHRLASNIEARFSAGVAGKPVPRPESALTPREMQDRLRAGWTLDEVATEAGVDPDWVARFAAPVLAELRRVVEKAQASVFDKPRVGESALPLGPSVRRNVADRGVALTDEEADGAWSAYSAGDDLWVVRFSYRSRGRAQEAEWLYDVADDYLVARNRLGSLLGHVTRARSRTRSAAAAVSPPKPPPVKKRAATQILAAAAAATAAAPQPPTRRAASGGAGRASSSFASAGGAGGAGSGAGSGSGSGSARRPAGGRKATGARKKAAPARKASAAKKATSSRTSSAKKAPARKAATSSRATSARKAPARKAAPAARKATATKAAARKAAPAPRKAAAKKAPPTRTTARKAPSSSRTAAPARRTAATKAPPTARKATPARKAAARKATPARTTARPRTSTPRKRTTSPAGGRAPKERAPEPAPALIEAPLPDTALAPAPAPAPASAAPPPSFARPPVEAANGARRPSDDPSVTGPQRLLVFDDLGGDGDVGLLPEPEPELASWLTEPRGPLPPPPATPVPERVRDATATPIGDPDDEPPAPGPVAIDEETGIARIDSRRTSHYVSQPPPRSPVFRDVSRAGPAGSGGGGDAPRPPRRRSEPLRGR